MGIFSSTAKPPTPVQAPQCLSDLFPQETAEMGNITETVNRLNLATFQAVSLARKLKNDKSLTPLQREQASEVKAVLKAQYQRVNDLAGELVCFNKTFDSTAKELVKARDALAKGGALLIDKAGLRTREGYSSPWLQNEVVRHRGFVAQAAREGIDDIHKSLIRLNLLTDAKGLPRLKGVSESWRNARALQA